MSREAARRIARDSTPRRPPASYAAYRARALDQGVRQILAGQEPVGDRDGVDRIVGVPGIGDEQWEVLGLPAAELVDRADDVSGDRSQHGGSLASVRPRAGTDSRP